MNEVVLKLDKITKKFLNVVALNEVDFKVYKSKVMGLAGENGAGKSTLMKIISGVYIPDSGEIEYKSEKLELKNPRDAIDKGIGIIHQELNLLPEMTIIENLFLGNEIVNNFVLNKKEMEIKAKKVLNDLGISLDLNTKIKKLSIAEQQMIEIAKVLLHDVDIIIMDEPTDALSEKETEKLFKIIEKLKMEGKSIVYISHRLEELFLLCDDITVFRDGNFIGEYKTKDLNKDLLIEKMVGRKLNEQFPKVENIYDEIVLDVKNISNKYVKDISFVLKKGEILGISGLVGSNRTELCKSLIGYYKIDSGDIYFENKKIRFKSINEAIKNKIYYVSEDRKKDGLILNLSVKDNMVLSSLKSFENKFLHINKREEINKCSNFIDKFKIKTPTFNQLVKKLSGGNQQKIAIAKAIMSNPKILILDEPTRGIDVSAKRDIYLLLNELKKMGISIILVSSEMPEIIGMSDRILVMSNGKITNEFNSSDVTQEKILNSYLL